MIERKFFLLILLLIVECGFEQKPFPYRNGQFIGQHNEGIPNGSGTLIFTNGNSYTGSFVNGEISGEGILTFKDGTKYSGYFINGKFHGSGRIDSLNGSSYVGEFKNGTMDGLGIQTYSNGNIYNGQWLNGQRHGIGKYSYHENSELMEYNGAWQFDEMVTKNDIELQDLFDKRKNCVFTIYAITDSFPISGSGFFINEEGVGLTNYHVLGSAKAAFLRTIDGSEYEIKQVIFEDEKLDFLIFKVGIDNKGKFQTAPIAKMIPDIGSKCFTISSPVGMTNTLSNGIISQYRGFENTLIQTTTPIDHGSSGSPLFNQNGEVIGINTMKIESTAGLNFAVNIIKILERVNTSLGNFEIRFIKGKYDELLAEYKSRIEQTKKDSI